MRLRILRIRSYSEIESFVKEFVEKYRRLSKNEVSTRRVFPGLIPRFFPCELTLEIKAKK